MNAKFMEILIPQSQIPNPTFCDIRPIELVDVTTFIYVSTFRIHLTI